MKKFLKWTGLVVAVIAALMLVGIAYIYIASERALDRRHEIAAPPPLVIPTDAASIEAGRHLARITGCLDCHGDDLSGRVVDDIPRFIRLVAPNISAMLPDYDDAQLVTVLRQGVKPDRTTVVFMPSEMFRHLADDDLARVIAFLRTVPPSPGVEEKSQLRIIARLLVAQGAVKLAADAIPTLPAPQPVDRSDSIDRGRYLVMNLCTECHGQDLGGFVPLNAPGLVVAKGYSDEQFARLLREGTGLGGRELRFMGFVSKSRFAHLRDEELRDIYAFLQARDTN